MLVRTLMLAIAFLDVSIDFFVCSYVSTYACANACAQVKIRLNCTWECTVLEPYTINCPWKTVTPCYSTSRVPVKMTFQFCLSLEFPRIKLMKPSPENKFRLRLSRCVILDRVFTDQFKQPIKCKNMLRVFTAGTGWRVSNHRIYSIRNT